MLSQMNTRLLNHENASNFELHFLDSSTHGEADEPLQLIEIDSAITRKTEDLMANKFLIRIIKTFVFLILVMVVSLGQTYGMPKYPVECLNDPLHNIFGFINEIVNTNKTVAGFFMISNSVFMDFTFFTIYIYWILYLKSCRIVLTCIFFYSLRAFCQILVQMRYPPGLYWDDPGFPSFIVPYGYTTDFFYSGHVGFLNIVALEWYKQKMYRMSYLTVCLMLYTIFVLLIFRAHYSIDIITGLIASNWIFTHLDINHEYLDRMFVKAWKKVLRSYVSKKMEKHDI